MRIPPPVRLFGATLVAMAVAWAIYATLEAIGQSSVSMGFLVVQPLILGAFVAWVGRAPLDWTGTEIFSVPTLVTIPPLVIGALLFREGVICLVMLAPLWFGAAVLGVLPVHIYRRNHPAISPDIFSAHALLLVPVLALVLEAAVPEPVEYRVVARSVNVATPPAETWNALLSIPAVAVGEGAATLTHDWLRVPRPLSAALHGSGVGAVRTAIWNDGIYFEEHITRWQPGLRLDWRFAFPDPGINRHTDRHIAPRGRHLRVEDGGYYLSPLPDGGTRITLWTRYRLTSHVNAYAGLWGDRFLADVEDNILAIVADRIAVVQPHPQS